MFGGRSGTPGRSRCGPTRRIPIRSAAGEVRVRGEHQTQADLTTGQRLLGQRAAGVQRLELTERNLVRVFQTLLAERPLGALGRPAHDGVLSGALAREIGQRLHADLGTQLLERGHRLVHVAGRLRLGALSVELSVDELGHGGRVLRYHLDLTLLQRRLVELTLADRLALREVGRPDDDLAAGTLGDAAGQVVGLGEFLRRDGRGLVVDVGGLVEPDQLLRVERGGYLVQRGEQLGRGRLAVDRRDHVVGVLEVLVVVEDDQFGTGDRGASPRRRVAGRGRGTRGAGFAAPRYQARRRHEPDQAQGDARNSLHRVLPAFRVPAPPELATPRVRRVSPVSSAQPATA